LNQWRTNGSPCAVFRAKRRLVAHREHCETRYAAKSWTVTRWVIARVEASIQGIDIRTIVTSIQGTAAERLYELDYCDRGQAENLPLIVCRQTTAGQWIKLHKTQLKSDRTSCKSAAANQMRLILHTAAYWLLWTVRQAIPEMAPLKRAEFTTLQTRLVKIGARIIETATRIRIAFASACLDKVLIAHLARSLAAPANRKPQAP
jgi:hypothetical protein